ncbi:MAG: hypothetical protein P4L33_10630 [Capsulimonadaceae bacterium]|nr:hypothetical protein [Capsulimonadaceae bacterium]
MPWYVVWYYPLTRLPEWLLLSAFFYLGSGLPQRIQNAKEGMAWNVAFSSFEGIVCETAVLGIGIEEMRAKAMPQWASSHALALSTFSVLFAIACAAAWTLLVRRAENGAKGSASDRYHNCVTVFLVAYFVLPCLVFAIMYGSIFNRVGVAIAFIWYAWSVSYDKKTLRSEQQQFVLLCGALSKYMETLAPTIIEIRRNLNEGRQAIDRPWWKLKGAAECRASMDKLATTLRVTADALDQESQRASGSELEAK